MILRKCKLCGIEANTEKDLDKFSKSSTCKYGRRQLCKTCKVKNDEKYRKDTNKLRNNALKWSYGITLQDYNIMFEEQKGKCLICQKHQTELKRKLFVDHCHSTGKVRGLLCTHCNTLLGNAKDNIEILYNAINYLEER